jgi:hypothetical protein
LAKGGALSLFEILRLHFALEFLRVERHPLYATLQEDPDQPIIQPKSVIPSLRLVLPESFKAAQQNSQVSSKHVQDAAQRVLKRRLPYNFMTILETGVRVGPGEKNYRPYRITECLAVALCVALEGTDDVDELKAAVDGYFPNDPTAGPGNGTYTKALRPRNGNQIRLI